jgi:hypothetical protein
MGHAVPRQPIPSELGKRGSEAPVLLAALLRVPVTVQAALADLVEDPADMAGRAAADRLARARDESGTQVRAVFVVPVAAFDFEVEVARCLEGHMGRRYAGRCAVPVPSARWIAYHVSGPHDVHAVLIGDDADAFDEHQVLAVVVLMRHGSRARAEVHGQGIEAGERTGKFLHPYVVRAVEQRFELVGYWVSSYAHRGTEFVHGDAPILVLEVLLAHLIAGTYPTRCLRARTVLDVLRHLSSMS